MANKQFISKIARNKSNIIKGASAFFLTVVGVVLTVASMDKNDVELIVDVDDPENPEIDEVIVEAREA